MKIWYVWIPSGRLACVQSQGGLSASMLRGEFQSYWSDTGTYESIRPLINMDFDDLKKEILAMLSGGSVKSPGAVVSE